MGQGWGRGRHGGETDRQIDTPIYCSTYLCIHWLILVCALTRDQTHNLGVLGRCSNQLSHPVRASVTLFEVCSAMALSLLTEYCIHHQGNFRVFLQPLNKTPCPLATTFQSSTPPSLRQPLLYPHSPQICLFWISYINGVTQHMILRDSLLSLSLLF